MPPINWKILQELAFTPERKQLLSRVSQALEEFVSKYPPKKAYVAGSFASKKPSPGDLDILAQYDYPIENLLAVKVSELGKQPWPVGPVPEKPFSQIPLHVIEDARFRGNLPGTKTPYKNIEAERQIKDVIKVAKERYGSGYKFVRFLTPIASAINALMSGETFDPVLQYLQGPRGEI